jgi:hypothetical protein
MTMTTAITANRRRKSTTATSAAPATMDSAGPVVMTASAPADTPASRPPTP